MDAVMLSPPDARDYTVSMVADVSGADIPADFEVWQPPVENQGSTGNCVAQSLANIMECIWVNALLLSLYGVDVVSMSAEEYTTFIRDNAELLAKLHENFSVGYIYHSPINTAETGMYPREGCEILIKQGDVLRKDWESYAENPEGKKKWREQVTEELKAKARKAMAYIHIHSKKEMQVFMLKYKLPVMLIAPCDAFSEDAEGRHATVCYGWISEDTYKANPERYNDPNENEYEDLLFTNSWGTSYHNKGRGTCQYLRMEEKWGIVPIDEGEDIMRGVEHLHPKLQKICADLVKTCENNQINVKITDTLRSKEEQNQLYAQGRTAPGSIVTNVQYPNSAHNWGVAFDICRNEKGREYDDSDGFFAKVGKIGESLGLTWGGSWKSFQDKPHFELAEFMPDSSTKWLKETYGSPDKFMETWSDEEMKEEKRYEKLSDIPNNWDSAGNPRTTIKALMDKGIINGQGNGVLDLSHDMVRLLIMLYRGGVFGKE